MTGQYNEMSSNLVAEVLETLNLGDRDRNEIGDNRSDHVFLRA